MWQTKYALVVPKNLGVGVDFQPFCEGNFLFTGICSPFAKVLIGLPNVVSVD